MLDTPRLRSDIEPSTGQPKPWVCLSDIEEHTEKFTEESKFQTCVEDLMRTHEKSYEDFVQHRSGEVWISSELSSLLEGYSEGIEELLSVFKLPDGVTKTSTKEPETEMPVSEFYSEETQKNLTREVVDTLGVDRFKTYNRKLMRSVSGFRSSFWKKATSMDSGREALNWANPRYRAQIALADQLVVSGYDKDYAIHLALDSEGFFEIWENANL